MDNISTVFFLLTYYFLYYMNYELYSRFFLIIYAIYSVFCVLFDFLFHWFWVKVSKYYFYFFVFLCFYIFFFMNDYITFYFLFFELVWRWAHFETIFLLNILKNLETKECKILYYIIWVLYAVIIIFHKNTSRNKK